MAYSTYSQRSQGVDRRTVEYGYGMDDIQRANEATNRTSALQNFQLSQDVKDNARALPGQFNRRGMLDSGQYKRAKERARGKEELARLGLMSSQEEARVQLDRQRNLLEEQLYGGLESDAIANALRRFSLAQALQGMV
jgi:hypothetical protein|tara:strand:+ start:859 stop:1272 length:414 start_codon:yes stop_codon:yes gene_type:complete